MSLSQPQLRAITLLNSGLLDGEVADLINVSRRTLQRWRKESEFSEALSKIQSKAVEVVTERAIGAATGHLSRIEGLITKGLDAIETILDDPESRADHKLKAASLLLARIPQPVQIQELEAIRVLVDLGVVPDETVNAAHDGMEVLKSTIRDAFRLAAVSESRQ